VLRDPQWPGMTRPAAREAACAPSDSIAMAGRPARISRCRIEPQAGVSFVYP
jgi:hypothetical protein